MPIRPKNEPLAASANADRIAEQQKHNQRREHDRRHVVDQEASWLALRV